VHDSKPVLLDKLRYEGFTVITLKNQNGDSK